MSDAEEDSQLKKKQRTTSSFSSFSFAPLAQHHEQPNDDEHIRMKLNLQHGQIGIYTLTADNQRILKEALDRCRGMLANPRYLSKDVYEILMNDREVLYLASDEESHTALQSVAEDILNVLSHDLLKGGAPKSLLALNNSRSNSSNHSSYNNSSSSSNSSSNSSNSSSRDSNNHNPGLSRTDAYRYGENGTVVQHEDRGLITLVYSPGSSFSTRLQSHSSGAAGAATSPVVLRDDQVAVIAGSALEAATMAIDSKPYYPSTLHSVMPVDDASAATQRQGQDHRRMSVVHRCRGLADGILASR
jgi:hypothetical protein